MSNKNKIRLIVYAHLLICLVPIIVIFVFHFNSTSQLICKIIFLIMTLLMPFSIKRSLKKYIKG